MSIPVAHFWFDGYMVTWSSVKCSAYDSVMSVPVTMAVVAIRYCLGGKPIPDNVFLSFSNRRSAAISFTAEISVSVHPPTNTTNVVCIGGEDSKSEGGGGGGRHSGFGQSLI